MLSLSLSLSILALSRVGHGQRSASQPGGEVWQRRESGCASGAWWGLWENSHAGDCVPAASGAHHHRRYGESCSTSCFHAPRAFHRARKKRGEEQGGGGKRYIIRGVARKFNSIARRGSHLLPRESRTPVDTINAGVSFRDEFKIDEIYRIEESSGFLRSLFFSLFF